MTLNKAENNLVSPGSSISNRWIVVKRIGGGGFGEIYNCLDKLTGVRVAIKIESLKASKQVLKLEVPIIRALQSSNYICRFYAFGTTSTFSYLVMSLQGKNLYDLRKAQKGKVFTLSTTLRLSISILKSIEDLHNAGYIHRDIKPSNFAIGRSKSTQHTVFMFDFGLTRRFMKISHCSETKSQKSNGFRGTIRYASANVHRNGEIGRNDDLWSAFYMFAEMKIGKLPWTKFNKKDKVGRVKQDYNYDKLLKYLPREYGLLLNYIRSLQWKDDPDYNYMRRLLYISVERHNIKLSDPYDWEVNNQSLSGDNMKKMKSTDTKILSEAGDVDDKNLLKDLTCYSVHDLRMKLPPIKVTNSRIIKRSEMGISKVQPLDIVRYRPMELSTRVSKSKTAMRLGKFVPHVYYTRYLPQSASKERGDGNNNMSGIYQAPQVIEKNLHQFQNSNSLTLNLQKKLYTTTTKRPIQSLINTPDANLLKVRLHKELTPCTFIASRNEAHIQCPMLVKNNMSRYILPSLKFHKRKKMKSTTNYSVENLVSLTNRISTILQSNGNMPSEFSSNKYDSLTIRRNSQYLVNNSGDIPDKSVSTWDEEDHSCSDIGDNLTSYHLPQYQSQIRSSVNISRPSLSSQISDNICKRILFSPSSNLSDNRRN